jgi:hypothetical protein
MFHISTSVGDKQCGGISNSRGGGDRRREERRGD